MRTLWAKFFKLRVAINMLVCALVFGLFGSYPRETISGFLGRRGMDLSRSAVWELLMMLVDALHLHERRHCLRVAREEAAAWRVLYPESAPRQMAFDEQRDD